jgi:hypothetical protein
VLSAAQLPRRVDHTDTVGSALLAAANGQGHRRIAAELELPADTVRGWLRLVRPHARSRPPHGQVSVPAARSRSAVASSNAMITCCRLGLHVR